LCVPEDEDIAKQQQEIRQKKQEALAATEEGSAKDARTAGSLLDRFS
jgi:DNA polymerase III delta prime subunit